MSTNVPWPPCGDQRAACRSWLFPFTDVGSGEQIQVVRLDQAPWSLSHLAASSFFTVFVLLCFVF